MFIIFICYLLFAVHTRHKGVFRIHGAFHSDQEHLRSGRTQDHPGDPRRYTRYHLHHCFLPQQASPTSCTARQARHPIGTSYSQRGSKKADLHTHNPTIRLASPLYTFNHGTLSDAPDVGFIPLHWALHICHQQPCASILFSVFLPLRTSLLCLKNCQQWILRILSGNMPSMDRWEWVFQEMLCFQSFCTKLSPDEQYFSEPWSIFSLLPSCLD